MKKLLLKKFLAHLIKNQCPMRLYTLGGDYLSNNCYYAYVYDKSNPILVIKDLTDHGVTGQFFKDEDFLGDAGIPYNWIRFSDIRVTHYYKGNKFIYSGILDYVLTGFTKINMFRARIYRIFSRIYQFLYNRKKLIMVQRHELLKVLVQHYIKSSNKGIDTLDLMEQLYSTNWISHPKRNEVEAQLELYLESLVESGELEKPTREYVVTGKAINTIESYENAERRHLDNIRSQKRIFFLTIVLIIFSLVQAKVIKLPTLIDLSKIPTLIDLSKF